MGEKSVCYYFSQNAIEEILVCSQPRLYEYDGKEFNLGSHGDLFVCTVVYPQNTYQ